MNGEKKKLTVPVRKKITKIQDIELCDWNIHRRKIIKTIEQAYSKAPYYDEIADEIYNILNRDYKYLYELNTALIMFFKRRLHIDCEIVFESTLNLKMKNASEDICDICKKLDSDKYYSGTGAKVYIEQDIFDKEGVEIIWSDYKPIEEGNLENMSVLDYVMKHKEGVPKEWMEN